LYKGEKKNEPVKVMEVVKQKSYGLTEPRYDRSGYRPVANAWRRM